MLQETTTWDSRRMWAEPSTSFKLYVLFILLTFGVTIIKLVRIWWAAPPFRLRPKGDLSKYVQTLRTSSSSMGRWIGLTFLAWGTLVSVSVVDVCYRLTAEKAIGIVPILFVISDYASALNAALFAVVFLYLSRWYILRRIELLDLARGD